MKEEYNKWEDPVFMKQYRKDYMEKNPDKKKEYNRYRKEYYENNKDKFSANQKAWVSKNPDYQKEYNKEYYIKNKEKIRKQQKEIAELKKQLNEFTIDLQVDNPTDEK